MADFSFSEDAELLKLNTQVVQDPEDFENWEKLVRAAEAQEGGLHRNSSPGAIASTREVYDKFLARYPLFFGYWKKYADLEFAIAGTEAAEMVYERGVASIGTSVDLWTNYCSFKVDTNHDPDVIRELFERGAESVGLDFLAHPFWDKYLEFGERMELKDLIFAILGRIVGIPFHQYARYFERYRSAAASRPIAELVPPEILAQFTQEVVQESGPKQKSEPETEAEVRVKIDAYHLEQFNRTQAETNKRWTYEQEIKRPYYHVTELDEPQLANWRKYLDFEEMEGDYARTRFLYERCLVTAANYDEFWLRYARWMLGQQGKQDEVRNIYQRASYVFVSISKPMIRMFWAQFEESLGMTAIAQGIYEAVLEEMPSHIHSIVALANLHRREYGLGPAIDVLKRFINNPECSEDARGTAVSEWARMLWKNRGDPAEARTIFERNEQKYLNCGVFFTNWLRFEVEQTPATQKEETTIKQAMILYGVIRYRSTLHPEEIRRLSITYFDFLKERGGKTSMKELMHLDREINGPVGVASVAKPTAVYSQEGGVTMSDQPAAAVNDRQSNVATPINGTQSGGA